MSIRKETMERIAALAKLELSQTELEQLSGELETIVDYMGVLAQLPAEGAEVAGGASPLHNVLRDDRVVGSPERSVLLANAPETDGVTLTVPKTVD